jgi:hypothetical protein
MLPKPRHGFVTAVRVIDAVNPFLIVLSVIGLLAEFTEFRALVFLPNQVISVLFALDFLIRLAAYPPGAYFFRNYGWVDFLASLPGFLIFLQSTPLLGVLKTVRIGRFFRIIRILRFLRAFDFIKRMKGDSPWIQQRIMQIGVSVVLIFVAGTIVFDGVARSSFESTAAAELRKEFRLRGNDLAALLDARPEIVFYATNGILHDRGGVPVADLSRYETALFGETNSGLEIAFSESFVSPDGRVRFPAEGVLIDASGILTAYDSLMLILVSTLLLILVVLIFYCGYIFAKDMRIVQLVVDSLDADDYSLLIHETEHLIEESGEPVLAEGDDELTALLKMAGKLARRAGSPGTGSGFSLDLAGLGGTAAAGEGGAAAGIAELRDRLDALEKKIDEGGRRIAVETVKAAAPALLKFVKQNLR